MRRPSVARHQRALRLRPARSVPWASLHDSCGPPAAQRHRSPRIIERVSSQLSALHLRRRSSSIKGDPQGGGQGRCGPHPWRWCGTVYSCTIHERFPWDWGSHKRIPKVIVQAYKTSVPHYIPAAWRGLNPGWEYRFFDDDDIILFLGENFGPKFVHFFNVTMPTSDGAHRADFFRWDSAISPSLKLRSHHPP
jgi:hypothetical protein